MRAIQDLKAEPRSGTGKGPAYQIRRKGKVPGIVYGGGEKEQVAVQVVARDLERHVGTGTFLTTLFMLDVDGKKTRVIPREVQLDPVSDRPVHVDFMRLAEGRGRHARDSGALQGPGKLARPEARRRAQHRAPRGRAALPGREHSRIYRGRSFRPRHPRHAAHLGIQVARRREADDRSATSRSPPSWRRPASSKSRRPQLPQRPLPQPLRSSKKRVATGAPGAPGTAAAAAPRPQPVLPPPLPRRRPKKK